MAKEGDSPFTVQGLDFQPQMDANERGYELADVTCFGLATAALPARNDGQQSFSPLQYQCK
ncbi:MAG TPA: hypothetical protein VNW30_07955 [Opitutaceae bacterium]|nr:hypothetical protein [Opitutaceae bacterium]